VIPPLILVGTVLTFSYVLTATPGEISGRYDVYRYFGPMAFYMDATIHNGEFPLWNPLTFCGMPFAANPQATAFYPPNLIRSLLNVNPTPRSTQVGLVVLMGLHLLLGAFGTLALARAHGLRWPGALTAAIAFTFSALMVRRVCEYHFVYTLNWLPLILVAVKHVIDASAWRAKAWWTALGGLLLGMSLLGGFLQVAVYVGVTVAGYAVLYSLLGLMGNMGRMGGMGRFASSFAAVALLFVLAVVVAAAMLWPAAELANFTAREKGEPVGLYSQLFNKSPVALAQDFLVYAGMKYQAEALRGSGVAALVLALAAVAFVRHRAVALFGILYLILLDCSFGPPLPFARLVDLVTPFAVSAYSRAYDVALLPLSLLAGFGVDGLLPPLNPPRMRSLRLHGELAFVRGGGFWRAGFFLCLSALLLIPLWHWVHPHPYLPVSMLVIIVPAVAIAFAVVGLFIRYPRWLMFALPLLVFGETLAWNWHYVPFLLKRDFTETVEEIGSPMPQDNVRGTDPMPNRSLYGMNMVMNGYDPLHIAAVRDVISGGLRAEKYHRLVLRTEPTAESNYGNLFLKRSFWLARQYACGPLPGKDELFPSATTVFLPEEPPGTKTRQRLRRVSAATNANLPTGNIKEVSLDEVVGEAVSDAGVTAPVSGMERLGKPLTAGQNLTGTVSFSLPQTRHSVLRVHYTATCPADIGFRFNADNRIEFGRNVHISPPSRVRGGSRGGDLAVDIPMPDFTLGHVNVTIKTTGQSGTFTITAMEIISDINDENDLIEIVSRQANSVELRVGELPAPRILTFIDAAYPGWEAHVDGARAPLLVANDTFKAVGLPEGSHDVRFVFRPTRAYAGIAMSVISLLAVAAFLILCRRARTA